ncbi:MAG: IPT/TIG domain-containing protein [Elusimicrobia bacterium]|nr:IPT/TIG domain-containing protein [Elusimicrobiota bacterium]
MKRILTTSAAALAFGLFFLYCGARAADSSTHSSLEAKLALESSLEKRVQLVLSEALGTSDIIVIISADMQEESRKKPALDFLPGIPQKEKVGEASLSTSLTMVKKISATLILDRNLPEEDVKLAKKLASGLLGLPAEREDLISVEKMNFRKTTPFSAADLLVPPNLWNVVWVALIALLGLVTVRTFFNPLSGATKNLVSIIGEKLSAQSSESGRPAEAPLPAALSPEAPSAKKETSGGEQGKKTPFWFITGENTASLAFILRTKSVEEITIVLSYVPKAVSAGLIEALYPRSVEALAGLPKVTLMPEAAVKTLEAELFSALDYVVGSEDKTMEIIEQLPETMQEKAVTTLAAQNPAFSRKVSDAIVRFNDIKYLEPMHAQMLARRLPMKNLAMAMKGSEVAQIFTSKLSEGMQERFRQELELTRTMPPEVQRAERLRLVMEIKKLKNEGFLTLDRTAQPASKTVKPALTPGQAASAPGKPPAGAAPGQKPAPAVTGISPAAMTADGTSQNLTISGSNFQSGNIVQFKWGAGAWKIGKTPAINSASQLVVSMNPGTVSDTIYVRVCRSALAVAAADCSSGTHSVSVTAAAPAPAATKSVDSR